MNITLTDPQAQKLGEKIISLLSLTIIPIGEDQEGVLIEGAKTSFGTKTSKGLARSIIRLIADDKELVGELKEILAKTE